MINVQLDGQLRMATLDPLEGKQFQVLKRDGRVIEFDETRIYLAIEAALILNPVSNAVWWYRPTEGASR